jgi:hypothetical protein
VTGSWLVGASVDFAEALVMGRVVGGGLGVWAGREEATNRAERTAG